jgi:hypothetical protein
VSVFDHLLKQVVFAKLDNFLLGVLYVFAMAGFRNSSSSLDKSRSSPDSKFSRSRAYHAKETAAGFILNGRKYVGQNRKSLDQPIVPGLTNHGLRKIFFHSASGLSVFDDLGLPFVPQKRYVIQEAI